MIYAIVTQNHHTEWKKSGQKSSEYWIIPFIKLLEDDIRENLDDLEFDVSYNTKGIIYKRNNW